MTNTLKQNITWLITEFCGLIRTTQSELESLTEDSPNYHGKICDLSTIIVAAEYAIRELHVLESALLERCDIEGGVERVYEEYNAVVAGLEDMLDLREFSEVWMGFSYGDGHVDMEVGGY